MPWLGLALGCAAMEGAFWLVGWLDLGRGATLAGGAVAGTLAYAGVLAGTGVLARSRVSTMLSGGSDGAETQREAT